MVGDCTSNGSGGGLGDRLYGLARDLQPYPRSLTGDGVRATLRHIQEILPGLATHEVPSGTDVFDWVVPLEWNLERAWIEDVDGNVLVDTDKDLLHVVGYSVPMDAWVELEDLDRHLHSIPGMPDAIPYVTSYYRRDWGFCLTERQRAELGPGPFRVRIRSRLGEGALTYGELLIPGTSQDEVLLSTYVCHPVMANNEVSGPVVLTELARWLTERSATGANRYSYRVLFLPETIGAITYLSQHLESLKASVRAGWVLTCIGDDRAYSYVPSRLGGTLSDRVSLQVLGELPDFIRYSYNDRGSDERQWCWPGVDLPVCSVMRSKYGAYPEYHTSLDRLGSVVTPEGLAGGLRVMRDCIELLESNCRPRATVLGEPHLSKRGRYPTISKVRAEPPAANLMRVLPYCDGEHDLIAICERAELPWRVVRVTLDELDEMELIRFD